MGSCGAAASNRQAVESLYGALSCGDTAAVAALLAEDVDWWFHGPRRCQHMRRLLTGEAGASSAFRFAPARVTEVGSAGEWVLADGWGDDDDHGDSSSSSYWVHAWLLQGGLITRFREYFNTSLTVRELGHRRGPAPKEQDEEEDADQAVWQSKPKKLKGRSMPGLVLAI